MEMNIEYYWKQMEMNIEYYWKQMEMNIENGNIILHTHTHTHNIYGGPVLLDKYLLMFVDFFAQYRINICKDVAANIYFG